MRVLITGGAGFIGSHLVEHFQGRAEVRVLDDFSTGFARNLEGFDCDLQRGSICDPDAVRRAVEGVDYVFHLAAMISVPQSMTQPQECVELNVRGLLNVLEASATAGVKKFMLASSAAIYGDNPTVPKVESMLPEPKSPYAITKLDGEYYCAMFAAAGSLETACLRFFNVFGPRQNPKSAYAAAVPIFISKALANEALTIYGDGGQTRDFVFVKDIVGALDFIARQTGAVGVYNCGYGQKISIKELAEKIIAAADSRSPVEHEPERPGDVRHSLASVDKLLATGWKPSSNLEEGLRVTLESFRSAAKGR